MPEYYVRQVFGSLEWQVVSLDWDQARMMRERGEMVYANPAQAHAIADRLNAARTHQDAI